MKKPIIDTYNTQNLRDHPINDTYKTQKQSTRIRWEGKKRKAKTLTERSTTAPKLLQIKVIYLLHLTTMDGGNAIFCGAPIDVIRQYIEQQNRPN